MAGMNQHSVWAAAAGANTMTNSAWAALTTLISNGFQPGVASSEQINTLLRQLSTVTTGTAKFAVDQSGGNALDDGSAPNFAALMLLAVQSVIDARMKSAGAIASGAIQAFAMSSAPTGWLKANGLAVSRVTYSSLFSAIGTTYGAGDGSTTFNLPDLRGEFLRGWDDERGVDPSRSFGGNQADEIRAHNHSNGIYANLLRPPYGGSLTGNDTQGSGSEQAVGPNDSQPIASAGGWETRPRNIALLYCIKT